MKKESANSTENEQVGFADSAVEYLVREAISAGRLVDVFEAFGNSRWEGLTEREAAQEVAKLFGMDAA